LVYFDVIIIGGGASGLMCAITAGQRGRRVLLVDSSNKVGKKILMSGGGRCNFANLYIESNNFISANPHFCISALNSYTQWDFIGSVVNHQIPYHERKHGQLFCDNSAKDILGMLLLECERSGVKIMTSCIVEKITALEREQKAEVSFELETSLQRLSCDSLVVATGGLSIPTMGSTAFGYQVAEQFSMNVLPRRAGLVPFTFSDHFKRISERLSGLALEVELSNGAVSFHENILFTHRGLSGPAVLQLSNYWQPGSPVWVNLLPNIELQGWLLQQKVAQPKALLRTVLSTQLAKNLVNELQSLFWPEYHEKLMADLPDKVLLSIADSLHNWQLKPSGTEGYRTAEVTLGGVDTAGLSSKTMESKTQSSLYFIGEVVDVTGHLGGFNFQWAWSSGFAAGQYV